MAAENLSFENTYEVRGEIGKGGGGTVYLAYHKRLQKNVVLKQIHGKIQGLNARNETDILKNIKSAYLPQVIDFIENGGSTYTVMEYIEGYSFEQLLKGEGYAEGQPLNEKQIPEQQMVKWYRQLAEALTVLHEQNPPIIHGDIKPANIMLTPEQIAFYRGAMQAAQTAASEATESYVDVRTDMSEGDRRIRLPENDPTGARAKAISKMQAVIDPRTDLYSLAATMYHIMTGERPKTKNGQIQDIRKQRKGITEPLAYLVMKCLEENPANRIQSARLLLVALDNLYQSTAAYKGMLMRQKLVRVALLAGTIGSALLVGVGVRMMLQERTVAYNAAVRQEEEARENLDGNKLEEAFSEAILLSQSTGDAYVEKAWFLYDEGEYEEGLHFILDEAIPFVTDAEGQSNLYMLAGMDYYELEDYKNAHEMYEEAIAASEDNARAYQEDAIVLAKSDQISEAEGRLETAVEHDLSDDGIAYTSGEIAYAKKEYPEAERYFEQAIEKTDDPYLLMRAYLMAADICDVSNQPISEKITLLEKAKKDVATQYQLPIIQELAQAYIDRFDEAGRESDADEAVKLLQGVIDDGYGNFKTYETMVVLYQKAGEYNKEETLLSELENRFGEDYRIYMYRAYMDALKQKELENESRNYKQFKSDYEKATQLYDAQKRENASDPMMVNLEEMYREVISGGW